MKKPNYFRLLWRAAHGVAAVAIGAVASGSVASADPVSREIAASAGRDVRVAVYANIRPDCMPGPLPAIRLVKPPVHGAVTDKRAQLKATNLKQCLAAEAPALVAFYRAAAGFTGEDAFDLEIAAVGAAKKLEHFHVRIGNGAGQGI
jgi:cell division septation protein DedD